MKGIKEEVFEELRNSIRVNIQDASDLQFAMLKTEFKTQESIRREISAAKIKGRLKVGDRVIIERDTAEYTITKINRTKVVGKHGVTNVGYNIPISMITEIL